MSIAFYTGVSGMMAAQTHMDVTANNIANVNTVGYKTQESAFQNLLYSRLNIHSNYDASENEDGTGKRYDMVGHGVRMRAANLMYDQGSFLNTERSLDFAINGEGLFAIETASGDMRYTRNGAFYISSEGRRAFLADAEGSYVLDRRGRQIQLEFDNAGNPITEGLADKLGVYHFANPYGLTPAGGGSFTATDISGAAKAAAADDESSTVLQGFLENSNVELSDQMVNLIQAQRSFQMNSRVVQAADQIDEMINNLR